jgi:halimadienyl-diphosphate synthase
MAAPVITINENSLTSMVNNTLAALGKGTMGSVAYDTAWAARLEQRFPKMGFKRSLEWLRRNQNPDGSWGEKDFIHYHDRFVSTLSALISLQLMGKDHKDRARIRAGERFLWHNASRLRHDPNDTIGFPVVSVGLLQEARALGLDVPRESYFDPRIVEEKLNRLGSDPKLWHHHTILFSFEGIIRESLKHSLNEQLHFLATNGSVACSPAATAALLLYMDDPRTDTTDFIRNTFSEQGDGGMPAFMPIDTFEIAWAIDQLRIAGAITPNDPQVKRALDLLWSSWQAERGVGTSSYFYIPDLDDTATSFAVLQWAGYPVSPNAFEHYERDDYFICFPVEANPSWSAMIRLLTALNEIDEHPRKHSWLTKILASLHYDDLRGKFFFDKWHVSPYYLRTMAVRALWKVEPEMARYLVHWISQTQNTDGGWGYGLRSTREETAYALNALMFWDRTVKKAKDRVNETVIENGIQFLMEHLNDTNIPALWIGKSLYNPLEVEKAAVLSALYMYMTRAG